ncbi:MAG TPA: glycosyltransferase [Phycisphaerae bacterium]|nr:glycosyltransferase [Phycisphaerae bacterium]
MFSVIICSIDPVKFARIQQHYRELFGPDAYELIGVHDARSMAEGYNRGIAAAKGEVVIFSHDDIEFLRPADWLFRLKLHLSRFDMLGLAGTTKLIYPAWAVSAPPYIFGQVAHKAGTKDWPAPYRLEIYGVPAAALGGIQAMDGVFLAVRRKVLQRIRFDEKTFNGFHCCDVDFTYCAYRAGFKLAVVCDMPALHDSTGAFDSEAWRKAAECFMQKHADHLPPANLARYIITQVSAETKEELQELMMPPQVHSPI